MKKIVLTLATFCFALTADAQTWGVFGGVNSTIYHATGVDFERDFGLEAGVTVLNMFRPSFGLRTGAGFVGKNSSSGSREYGLTYLEIPVTLLFRAGNKVQLFGGLNVNLNLADKCEVDGGACAVNAESLVMNLPIGARIGIEGPHYIEPIVEFGLTDVEGSAQIGNSLSVRYVYLFR